MSLRRTSSILLGLAFTGAAAGGAAAQVPTTLARASANAASTDEAAAAAAGDDSKMGWVLKPYLWAAGMEGTVEIDQAGGPVDASFGEIVDSLDFGAMAALEMHPADSKWGFLFDTIYMRVEKDLDNGDIDVTQTMFEFDAAYQLGDKPGFDALFGLRYMGLQADIAVNGAPSSVFASEGWVDPIVGARGSFPFLQHFSLDVRGDVGGFGIGSNYATQFQAEVAWHVNHWFGATAGWRYMKVDFDDGDFEYRVAMTGPIVGVVFRF